MKQYTNTLAAALGGLLITASASQAALLVNGDFSSAIVDSTNLNDEHLDTGWKGKTSMTNGFSVIGGEAVAGTVQWGFGQVNTLGSESGNLLRFSFDWTPDAGATGDALSVDWQMAGWTATAVGTRFGIVNAAGLGARTDGGSADFTVYDLVGGSSSMGNVTPVKTVVTGVAGTTLNYTIDVDISGVAGSGSDLSTLNYFGVAFNTVNGTATGGTLDNVSVITVPEPSSAALLGLGGLVLILRRRK